MKKIDLGQTVAIFANLGVIAGILLLVLELRQNNQLLQAEAIGEVLDTRMNRTEQLIAYPEIAALVTRNENGEPLTATDRQIIGAMHSRELLGWQKDFFLYQRGILDEELLRSNLIVMRIALRENSEATLPMIAAWSNWRIVAFPGFRNFVEQCVFVDCEMIPQ